MKKYLIAVLLLIAASTVYGSGLYDKKQTPIDGTVTQYRRMPIATITNTINQTPSIQMVTETVKLYSDGTAKSDFLRRVTVEYMDFYDKKYPLFNPSTGAQVGLVDSDTLYAMLYSVWILGEKKADGQIGLSASDPAIICYTTNGNDALCPLLKTP